MKIKYYKNKINIKNNKNEKKFKKNKIKQNKIKKTKIKKTNKKNNFYLNILCLTSLLFITNIITAFYKKYYLYSFLFCFITITSLIFHSYKNIYTNIIDKIAIFSIIIYGLYILINNFSYNNFVMIIIIIFSFILCLYLYFYGYLYNVLCFHHNKNISNIYHGLLHLISSLGHHCIIFL